MTSHESIQEAAKKAADLTCEKNDAYGDSFRACADYFKILYPNGIKPEQFEDALLLARDFDKSMRVAHKKDAFGENPWKDKLGYALVKVASDNETANNVDGRTD
jgi:hypothetical protein